MLEATKGVKFARNWLNLDRILQPITAATVFLPLRYWNLGRIFQCMASAGHGDTRSGASHRLDWSPESVAFRQRGRGTRAQRASTCCDES
ncbi:hypothetical protein SLEP1_g12193 [Rubroshorea leprosula]|uniref:Uncharacterized protein n=1 Tax=Rubroshorea leprosula TaxID=152421 RepID=A0AAV5IL37_9ROSI|nr:hypothetical protein SLEP1_g12193 [Rubroshorea leprosula]